MPTSANRPYIAEVDQIRGYAVLLILIYHGLQIFSAKIMYGAMFEPRYWLYTNNPFLSFVEEGHSGVGLFIVLSGFILTIGAVDRDIVYREFLRSRVLRIYPLYVLYLIIGIHSRRENANILGIIQDLLQLSNLPGAVDGGKFTSMLWAVSIEFQCYLVFPFLLMFSNARGTAMLLWVVAVIVALRIFLALDGANVRDLTYWTVVGRFDQFCIGMIAARVYVQYHLGDRLRARWVALSSSLVILAIFAFHKLGGWPSTDSWKVIWPTVEGGVWAFFVVTYISAGKFIPSRISGMFVRTGKISYSLYLGHFFIIVLISNYGLILQPTENPYWDAIITSVVIAAPISIAFAALTYKAVEMPFLTLRRRYIALAPKSSSGGDTDQVAPDSRREATYADGHI